MFVCLKWVQKDEIYAKTEAINWVNKLCAEF